MDIVKLTNQATFPIPRGYCIDWINGPEQRKTVALQCPNCGHAFCLENHSIHKDGEVIPSVVCPYNCGFHEMVTIKG